MHAEGGEKFVLCKQRVNKEKKEENVRWKKCLKGLMEGCETEEIEIFIVCYIFE